MTSKQDLKQAIRTAVGNAINEVGLDNFKRTSMFMSNQRNGDDLKAAA
ncbi:hypothetical protein [Rhizobium rhizogenes]|nr:hypothetical protein [Rhizobium rhizogenes]NTF43057.1 hypothetical protein [Rhizobium rhizogenes]